MMLKEKRIGKTAGKKGMELRKTKLISRAQSQISSVKNLVYILLYV